MVCDIMRHPVCTFNSKNSDPKIMKMNAYIRSNNIIIIYNIYLKVEIGKFFRLCLEEAFTLWAIHL